MRKFWIVLLSVGLIMAFTMPVLGADVKFSGTYVVQGYYDNNRALSETGTANARDGASISDMWQRLRLQTDFQVAEGLKLTTRADIMERVWGVGHTAGSSTLAGANPWSSAAVPLAQQEAYNSDAENIRFNNVYVSANLFGGLLRVGYQTQTVWGTAFGDSGDLVWGPRIRYDYVTGPWTFIALYDWYEGTKAVPFNGSQLGAQVDQQEDAPAAAFIYTWAKGNAGLLVKYVWNTSGSGVTPGGSGFPDNGFKQKYWLFLPYWKAQFGPVYTEGEIIYKYGKKYAYESDATAGDVTYNSWSGWVMASVDIKPAYVGAAFIYVEGDSPAAPGSPNTTDNGGQAGGVDFNPCLILFNYDSMRWNGGLGWGPFAGGAVGTPINNSSVGAAGITNAWIAQVFGGIKPVPKLDVKAAVIWAKADKDPAQNWTDRNYGWEGDLTATYKIYDNLSYMVGFGYLWAGDFWKGTQSSATVKNDYLVTHKLTLSF